MVIGYQSQKEFDGWGIKRDKADIKGDGMRLSEIFSFGLIQLACLFFGLLVSSSVLAADTNNNDTKLSDDGKRQERSVYLRTGERKGNFVYINHVIRKGDDIYSLAKFYKVPSSEITEQRSVKRYWNKKEYKYELEPGGIITIRVFDPLEEEHNEKDKQFLIKGVANFSSGQFCPVKRSKGLIDCYHWSIHH